VEVAGNLAVPDLSEESPLVDSATHELVTTVIAEHQASCAHFREEFTHVQVCLLHNLPFTVHLPSHFAFLLG